MLSCLPVSAEVTAMGFARLLFQFIAKAPQCKLRSMLHHCTSPVLVLFGFKNLFRALQSLPPYLFRLCHCYPCCCACYFCICGPWAWLLQLRGSFLTGAGPSPRLCPIRLVDCGNLSAQQVRIEDLLGIPRVVPSSY